MIINIFKQSNKLRKFQFSPKFYFSAQQFDARTDYYKILGLNERSTPDEIKKTYYQLAKQYHPDIYKGKDTDRFKQISDAYRVLGDKDIKSQYDNVRSGSFSAGGSSFDQGGNQYQQYYNMGQRYNYTKTRKYGPGFGPNSNFYQQYNAYNQHQHSYNQSQSHFYDQFKQNMYTDFGQSQKTYQNKSTNQDYYNMFNEFEQQFEREHMAQLQARMRRRLILIGGSLFMFWFFFEFIVYRSMTPKQYMVYDNDSNTMYVTDEGTFRALQTKNQIREDPPRSPYNPNYQSSWTPGAR